MRLIESIERHKKQIGAIGGTAVLTASAAFSMADIRGSQALAGQIDHGTGNSKEQTLTNWVRMDFLTFHMESRSDQRKVADSLVGRKIAIIIDTQDLRLHEKLRTTDHAQFDMNMNPEKYPVPPGEGYDGHPVELRVTPEQEKQLKKRYGEVKDPQAQAENSFPGDIPVKDAVLVAEVEKLARGDNPKESYSEFVLQEVIPTQVATK